MLKNIATIMAYSRSKKSKRRRPTRKRGRRGYRKSRVSRSLGWPSVKFAKIDYTVIRTANVLGAALWSETYVLNGLFDPEYRVGGGQPLYFDQFCSTTMYTRYVVYACKATFKISCGTTSTNVFHPTVCITPTINVPTYTTIDVPMQNRQSVFRNIVPGNTTTTMSKYYKISSLYGVPKKQITSEEYYSGSYLANPTNPAYVTIYFMNNDGTATFPVTNEVKLTFYAKFYKLANPSAS